MLVRGSYEWNQTLLTFLKPFTWRLWITVIGACIFIGASIAILEYRVGNPKFAIPLYQKLIMIVWFPISTFFFQEGINLFLRYVTNVINSLIDTSF